MQTRDQKEIPASHNYMKVADFFTREHFTVTISPKSEEGDAGVRASSADCRILVAQSNAEGFHRDKIRAYAAPNDSIFVVFNGKAYAEQPTLLTVAESLFFKIRRELGLPSRRTPVFYVIASRSCEAEKLPWAELR